MSGASFRRVLTQADFDRFARLSGDDNPIHCDPAFARRSHFGATVSHGMLLYGHISRAFSEWLPGGGVLQLGQDLMFPHPTFAGEEVTITLEPVGAPWGGAQEVQATVTKAGGIVTAQGRARLALPGARPAVAVRAVDAAPGDRELYGLKAGMAASTTRTFHDGDLDEYVGLVGDRNPLFLGEAAAQREGFAGRLVPPALLAGMFSDLFGTRLPGRGTGWMKQQMVFPAVACVGTALTASVAITRLRADKELVNLQCSITDERGTLVCVGEALVLVRNLENKRAVALQTL